MIQRFHHQESDYQAFLDGGAGFVCNNIGMGPRWHRLHRSDCNMLNRAGPAKTGLHTSVAKICSHDLHELVQAVTREYGSEGVGFKYCHFCFKS